MNRKVVSAVVLAVSVTSAAAWTPPAQRDLTAEAIGSLDPRVLADVPGERLTRMLEDHARERMAAANRRSTDQWRLVSTPAQWEQFRRGKLDALRTSLGRFPEIPGNLHTRVTRTVPGEGYVVENLVFESRPGLWVTANLYRPEPVRPSMPGILLCHSHHNPKTQVELQDMGMTWARAGCLVLVMDQLGHGERRQHPFASERDYAGEFPVGRQDYYFRYNTGIQLQLIGDSLMGWMVWDLRRGVDLLLSRVGTDPTRIILMGSVAGGGDPAAVTAALDERISAAVPFNFGGPQPETPFPLAADPENTFDYAGSGSWEPTRNLRLSCRDGFLPWVIIGSIAPRRLIYAHEFSWDREHDPVWNRLHRIYAGFYGSPEALDYTSGFGLLQGRPPDASHCNNIGSPHRQRIHEALQRWFGIPGGPAQEYQNRLPAGDLQCMTSALAAELKPPLLQSLVSQLGHERALPHRRQGRDPTPAARTPRLQDQWRVLLGNIEPGPPRIIRSSASALNGLHVERVGLETEPGIFVPVLILTYGSGRVPRPVVVALSHAGKAAFLRKRAAAVSGLVRSGAAVCLPDLRGTGETSPDRYRGRSSEATSVAATELMLGETLVGARLRDVRSTLRFLRMRPDLDAGRIAVWGDSFAPVNPPGRELRVPLGISDEPSLSEPDGALLAVLSALFETDVRTVYARGGLTGFESVLHSEFCYLPYDAVIPGVLTAGDLCAVAASLAPKRLRLEGLVDGLNRRADPATARSIYQPAFQSYKAAGAAGNLVVGSPAGDADVAEWIIDRMKPR